MILYSKKSHRKIVHLPHCPVLRRIDSNNRSKFETIEEAKEHGYHLCKCCSAMYQNYRKEKSEVDRYCKENGMQLKVIDDVVHIISKYDCWRIIFWGKRKKMRLFHKNTQTRATKENLPNVIVGFHEQPVYKKTILDYLEYIKTHDDYRKIHPCTENRGTDRNPGVYPKESMEDWRIAKFGGPWEPKHSYKPIKGTKKYKKQQRKKKRQERSASIIRVNALIEELAAMNG